MPKLLWDWGTAYDLFISLEVLHDPAEYDLPGAWAAGMRARLGPTERQVLEQSKLLLHCPFHWIYKLPRPKDASTALWSLSQVPPAERLWLLAPAPFGDLGEASEVLRNVAARGSWKERDRQALAAAYSAHLKEKGARPLPAGDQERILDTWARGAEFGEHYLEALRRYQEVFFAEEEKRIGPALQAALARAQALAKKLTFPDLLEELSQGLRVATPFKASELVLAPSYWATPLVFMGQVGRKRDIWLFGARPPTASLVPGEAVSDSVVHALKALSDPTRLRILQYLAEGTVSPAQLAKRLRLRMPTVLHHLRILRLAGLVQVNLGEGKDKSYAARPEAVAATFSSLRDFLEKKGPE